MLKTILRSIAVLLAAAALQQQSTAAQLPASQYRDVLNRYCVTCHNEKLKTAGLLLDKLDLNKITAGAEVWEKVIRKLRTGAMPPAGLPRPDQATYSSLATYLETSIDRAAAVKPNPGRPAIHRLNRTEYANAIRDLLALEIDGESFLPADNSGYGFDNMGDVLSVSPMLLERYMSAAGKIRRLAIGDPAIKPVMEMYDLDKLLVQEDRMGENLPFGSRGGIAVRHFFPLDGEYLLKIRLQQDEGRNVGKVFVPKPHQLDVRLDGERIKLITLRGQNGEKQKPGPEASNGASAGDLELRFQAKAGSRLIAVTFLDEAPMPEGVLWSGVVNAGNVGGNLYEGDHPALDSIAVGGPYDSKGVGETPSRHKIFVCHPTASKDEEPCARRIISVMARRAYRRPVTAEDLQTLLTAYKAGRSEGDFEAGIGMALERMLVSPMFLFRPERDPANVVPGTAYRLNDLELASRLSFFLWSTIPDDQLLDLAEQGKLKDPTVLEGQVRRMLRDARSKSLVNNFAGQWLQLRTIRTAMPDTVAFPDFDENLREAFQKEAELFLESMVKEDRPLTDLLDANYTFLNERLAKHYGIPNVYGSHFRRITLNDEERRGLLGKGSILTVTSYANRTSPVLRGKWVLENILGTPPPPPPPNVPALKDNDDTKVLTMRQRMEQHRANPVCAGCHSRMDPLGFALDNFDAIGKWRDAEGHTPIDPSGTLPDGTKFQGVAGLEKILMSHPEQFVATATEKLLTYALGKEVKYYDEPAIRRIMREAAPGNYRWSALIIGIVKSTPFQMRRSAEASTVADLR